MNHAGTNPQKKAVVIIPARFDSSRLPGKPLVEIAGKPMICWVAERAQAARSVTRVVVATDDARVYDAVSAANHEAMMTKREHATGTDRLAEVAASLNADVIVNVQGDEPLISPETIDLAVDALLAEAECAMATTWEPIDSVIDVLSPDVVKVVTDQASRALYFSRSPIPFPQAAVKRHGSIEAALTNEPALLRLFRKHTGLYVYRREFLLEFAGWPQSPLERAERLEQLRALEHGARIKVVEACAPSIGVDTAEDLERVRAIVKGAGFESRAPISKLETRNSKLETF